jgi:hypothetical protein
MNHFEKLLVRASCTPANLMSIKTNSMEQRPSWEASRYSATEESLNILWNPKVHYLVHKSPTPVPILKQINK